MSITAIDSILWNLHFEAERSGDYYARIGADAAAWYIGTGRASTDWIQALSKASPKRLLARVSKAGAGCEEAAVRTITRYLKRYCGY